MEYHFGQKAEIYFHDDKSRFYYDRLRFSWCQIGILLWMTEIFMITGQDFIMNGWDFHDVRSRILLWMTEIFMMIGQDFHNNRLRSSWWQVEIFSIAIVIKVPWFWLWWLLAMSLVVIIWKSDLALNGRSLQMSVRLHSSKIYWAPALNERPPQIREGALIWKFATSAEALSQIVCKNDETGVFFS